MRRLDAALELKERTDHLWTAFGPGLYEGGVKPPHSKALRAFSCFPGAHQPTGMSDRSPILSIPDLPV